MKFNDVPVKIIGGLHVKVRFPSKNNIWNASCARANNGHPKYPHTNPQNLGICYFIL